MDTPLDGSGQLREKILPSDSLFTKEAATTRRRQTAMVQPRTTTPKAGTGQEGAYLLMVIGAILLLPIIAVIRSVLSERRRNNHNDRADLRQPPAQHAVATTAPVAENTSEVNCPKVPTTTSAAAATTTTTTNNWRCVCEQGFLPPGMFGNAEAVLRMGTGQCYHNKKRD
jgi:hypothetical protein